MFIKKRLPVWFFTNEKIGTFLPLIEKQRNIARVFAIGGGGDLAFSLLSSFTPEAVIVCDQQELAIATIDLKKEMIRVLQREEFIDLCVGRRIFDLKDLCGRVKTQLASESRKTLSTLENLETSDFLAALKKSRLWHRGSLWQISHAEEYLPYLASESTYAQLQDNLGVIRLVRSDFTQTLLSFPSGTFDLIYVSNIFDGKDYCPNPALYLKTIRERLDSEGVLLAVTQHYVKTMRLLTEAGFYVGGSVRNRFNILSSLLGHFSYSFLLLRRR